LKSFVIGKGWRNSTDSKESEHNSLATEEGFVPFILHSEMSVQETWPLWVIVFKSSVSANSATFDTSTLKNLCAHCSYTASNEVLK
jgi:hypothetical protein